MNGIAVKPILTSARMRGERIQIDVVAGAAPSVQVGIVQLRIIVIEGAEQPHIGGIAALGAGSSARQSGQSRDGFPRRTAGVRGVAILGIVEIEVCGAGSTSAVQVASLAVAGVSGSLEGGSVLRNRHPLVAGIRRATHDEQTRDGVCQIGRGLEAHIDILSAATLVQVLVNDGEAGIGQLRLGGCLIAVGGHHQVANENSRISGCSQPHQGQQEE